MNTYSLVVRNVKNFDEFKKLDEMLERMDLERYVFTDGKYYLKEHEAIFDSYEEQAWPKRESEMIQLSEQYPNMSFELTCQQDDTFWRIYYRDGLAETCTGGVVFEKPKKIKWDELLAF